MKPPVMVESSTIMDASTETPSLIRLRKSWLLFMLICLGFLITVGVILSLNWQRQAAFRWAVQTAVIMGYLIVRFRAFLCAKLITRVNAEGWENLPQDRKLYCDRESHWQA